MKMLLVDQDAAICQGMARTLTAWSNDVEVTLNEDAAWAALRDHDYDVLIAQDQMLHDASRSELENLKVAHPRMAILILTHSSDAAHSAADVSPDGAITLYEPFSIPRLVDAIAGAHQRVRGAPAAHWELHSEQPREDSFRHWGLNE